MSVTWLVVAAVANALVQPSVGQHVFRTATPAEIIATLTVRCDACAWEVPGREAVVLTVTLDGRYLQHLPVVRSGRAAYRILLGAVGTGDHTVRVELDQNLTASALRGGSVAVETIAIEQIGRASPEHPAVSLAPIVYARPDTIGRFTDVPVFMWYEVEPTDRGRRFRYSIVFTNEDGGTPADRLMATWGRTTDIEYVYSVEIDGNGAIVADDYQGPEHKVLPFAGQREGRHPLLWVTTENNMVLDHGSTRVRYAPAPHHVTLANVSRETVMDANPWLYALMAHELAREKKIVAGAPPGKGTIPDPRRFVYLEGCGEVGDRAVAFAVRIGTEWIPSDRGLAEYRIARDGCFRAATPLPDGVVRNDIRAVRAEAFARSTREGDAPARLTRVNRVFMLDEHFVPGPSILTWHGSAELRPGGAPFELPIQ